jgi:hypothetical protein
LGGFALTDGGLEQIAGSSWFTRLEDLDLSCNRLTDVGLAILAQARLPQLRQLKLARNDRGFSVPGVSSLVLSGALNSLWSLSIDMADERLLRAIAQSGMNQLIELAAHEEYQSDASKTYETETIRLLAESPVFARADGLWIGYVDWTDACDGHGPIPRACLDEAGIDLIRRSSTLRAATRQELTLLNTREFDGAEEDHS